jgi:hypothetical protein
LAVAFTGAALLAAALAAGYRRGHGSARLCYR